MEQFIQLTLLLIVLIVLARAAALLGGRLGLPAAPVQLLIGILLGPSLFNLLGMPIVLGTWGSIDPGPLHRILKVLAEIGLIQLMFFAGLRTDWHQLKSDLKLVFSIGSWSFVLTALGVTIIIYWLVDRWAEALAIGAIMSASSFGILLHHLGEMKLLESPKSSILSGGAIVSGLLAMLLMIASQATNYGAMYGVFRMTVAVSWFLGKLIMFFAISYFLASRFINRIAKTGFQKRPRQMLVGYLLLVASLYAWAAMHFGSFAAACIASLGGALLGTSNVELKEKIAGGMGSVFASLPIGILFVIFGMEVDFRVVWGQKTLLTALFVVVIFTKLIGSWVAVRKVIDSLPERILVMLGNLYQGEMGFLIAAYLFSRGVVNPSQFNSSITVVVVLTIVIPILTKYLKIPLTPSFSLVDKIRPRVGGGEG